MSKKSPTLLPGWPSCWLLAKLTTAPGLRVSEAKVTSLRWKTLPPPVLTEMSELASKVSAPKRSEASVEIRPFTTI